MFCLNLNIGLGLFQRGLDYYKSLSKQLNDQQLGSQLPQIRDDGRDRYNFQRNTS